MPRHRHQVCGNGFPGPFDSKSLPIDGSRPLNEWALIPTQGLSYSSSKITIPSLELLPTSVNAVRSLHEAKRLTRKHGLQLTNIANACLLFAYLVSPRHRKHPYMLWMCVSSAVGSYGADYWFNRGSGFQTWILDVAHDTGCLRLLGVPAAKKDEDLVVVETEEGFNGESVQREMNQERLLQSIKAGFSGAALAMGIVGLWGDRS